MTFTPFTIETLRSLTLNEVFMGRIKLATRSCFWIDPLVKPVRLAALKRIAYDKPIRKQLILSKLVQSNDSHMNLLERLAVDAQIRQLPVENQEEVKTKVNEPEEITMKSNVQEEIIPKSPEEKAVVEDLSLVFKPFLNRIGQLIINPVGRSKEFFSKHNQQLTSEFVKPISSLANDNEQSNRYIPLGRGHRLNSELSQTENNLNRPKVLPVNSQDSTVQPITNLPQSVIDSNVTTPSEIGPNKMTEIEQQEEEEDEIFEVIN
jgi:hypothetical protein